MNEEELKEALKQGILCWYDFSFAKKILCLGYGSEAITNFIDKTYNSYTDSNKIQIFNSLDSIKNEKNFDIIISIHHIYYEKNLNQYFSNLKSLLCDTGKLLLGFNNRLGLRYFCGDRDPFTDRNFDSIENYRHSWLNTSDNDYGRLYSKYEVTEFLNTAGFNFNKFYSIMPNIELAQLIYADDYLPEEELVGRCSSKYYSPETIFLEEEPLYKDIVNNKLFHQMANAYLVECCCKKNCNDFSNALHITNSITRGKEHGMTTIIRNDNKVEKKSIYNNFNKIQQLKYNEQYLVSQGLSLIEGKIEKNSYIMPYIKGENLVFHMTKIFYEDQSKFIDMMDQLAEIATKSSEHLRVDEELGIILKNGFLDLFPANCMYIDNQFVFYDQEFCIPELPLKTIIFRMVEYIYLKDIKMEKVLSKTFFFDRYEITPCINKIVEWVMNFENSLGKHNLWTITSKYLVNPDTINTNRLKMNYTAEQYRDMFFDIFHNVGNKKIVVFGAGRFASEFIDIYRRDFNIHCIVDNNTARLGEFIQGIEIKSTDILSELIDNEDYKVIICIKSYIQIIKQLENIGIINYGVYQKNISYKTYRPIHINDDFTRKKYRTGYILGVFDMFHIGHLNLLKRAKEQCEYLIVGIVSDEDAFRSKNKYPIITFEERLEIVDACKYVDMTVEQPLYYSDMETIYELYKYDCQFSGSDHETNNYWLGKRDYLRSKGSDLIFMPYTDSISSTKLRKELKQ